MFQATLAAALGRLLRPVSWTWVDAHILNVSGRAKQEAPLSARGGDRSSDL